MLKDNLNSMLDFIKKTKPDSVILKAYYQYMYNYKNTLPNLLPQNIKESSLDIYHLLEGYTAVITIKENTEICNLTYNSYKVIIKTLLQSKIFNLASTESYDNNLLYVAAALGTEVVNIWPEIMETYPETSFHTVNELGFTTIITDILRARANPNVINNKKESPLMIASTYNKINVMEILTSYGADANFSNHENWTPIFAAAQNGQIEAAKFLLDHGAKLDAVTTRNETPLMMAAKNEHKEVMKLFNDHKAKEDLSNTQSKTIQESNTPIIISADNDIKTLNKNLLTACIKNNPTKVKSLLEQGANPNGPVGITIPILYSCANGYIEITKLLLEYGANPNITGKSASNALHLVVEGKAAEDMKLDMIKLLIKYGAVFDTKNNIIDEFTLSKAREYESIYNYLTQDNNKHTNLICNQEKSNLDEEEADTMPLGETGFTPDL